MQLATKRFVLLDFTRGNLCGTNPAPFIPYTPEPTSYQWRTIEYEPSLEVIPDACSNPE